MCDSPHEHGLSVYLPYTLVDTLLLIRKEGPIGESERANIHIWAKVGEERRGNWYHLTPNALSTQLLRCNLPQGAPEIAPGCMYIDRRASQSKFLGLR